MGRRVNPYPDRKKPHRNILHIQRRAIYNRHGAGTGAIRIVATIVGDVNLVLIRIIDDVLTSILGGDSLSRQRTPVDYSNGSRSTAQGTVVDHVDHVPLRIDGDAFWAAARRHRLSGQCGSVDYRDVPVRTTRITQSTTGVAAGDAAIRNINLVGDRVQFNAMYTVARRVSDIYGLRLKRGAVHHCHRTWTLASGIVATGVGNVDLVGRGIDDKVDRIITHIRSA